MATAAQLSENSHQGFDGLKAALCLGSMEAKPNTASVMPVCLWQEGIGSRSSGKERDAETGLDYFLARYYSGTQGRFTSPDEFKGGAVDPFTGQQISQPGPLPYADISNPQTLNKYAYVMNNPLRYTDPDGHIALAGTWGGAAAGTFICGPVCTVVGAIVGTVAAAYVGYEAGNAIGGLISKSETKPETKTSDGSTSQDKTESKVNTNPYAGPVDKPVTVVDPKGNAIPVGEGQRINSSPKGDYQQVLDKNGKPTGDRLDAGGHKKQTNPRAQRPHAHRPKVTNEDGDPHLPIN
jgi:RHS repeat-associated protein